MAIFRSHDPNGRERSAEDRRRHKELVEESIKKNIGSIIAEESIIGQSQNKKIRIPIRGIKEYSFIYGKNVHGAASGDGDEKRGDVVGEEVDGRCCGQAGAGNQEGEDIYETEITIEEMVNYLFEDLKLPDIDKKKLSDSESENANRKLGYRKKGVPPRLAKKRSVVEKIKRRQSMRRNSDGAEEDGKHEDRFPFTVDDLRYRKLKTTYRKDFNAVVLCIMDVSGSMDMTKKYMARSFYFLLYQFLKLRYSNVEVVFVAHTTTAKEVGELEFFHKGESGGTYISSGYAKALEIIEQRYNPRNWNIYAFHCSDGDNWTEDNKKAVELAEELCKVCNLFGYGEIVTGYYCSGSTVKSEYIKSIAADNFVMVTMSGKDDIITGIKRLLEKNGEKM